MIRAILCFVAEGVSIDRDSGQFTAYAVIERLAASAFPLLVPRLAFFCLWERAGTDSQVPHAGLSVSLNGQVLAHQEIPIDFEQYLRTRCAIRLDMLTITEPGSLVFKLTVPDHHTAEWAIDILATEQAASVIAASDLRPTRPLYESQPVSISAGTLSVHRP